MRFARIAAVFAAAMPGLMASPLALAQNYHPAKAVRVITPWPAGGLTDVVGRIVFQKISETAGQQFIVDNRPGAELVAKSEPDGYTLMVHSTTHVGGPRRASNPTTRSTAISSS